MKRLTERLENGVIHVNFMKEKESAAHRLADIEDILGDDYDLDRLRELLEVNQRAWISSRERLPEPVKDVLVCYKDGDIDIDWVDHDGEWTLTTAHGEPTHWMPLPNNPNSI